MPSLSHPPEVDSPGFKDWLFRLWKKITDGIFDALTVGGYINIANGFGIRFTSSTGGMRSHLLQFTDDKMYLTSAYGDLIIRADTGGTQTERARYTTGGKYLFGTTSSPSGSAVFSAYASGQQWGTTGGAALIPVSGGGMDIYTWTGTVGSETYTLRSSLSATGLAITGSVSATTQLISSVATGTAPLVVSSTTAVANLTANTVTTNANLTGPITSVGNATSIASQTGTGTKFVVDNTPTLITPNIGAATGTSLTATGLIKSSGTAGIGYGTGAGGTVSQGTNKSNSVNLNTITGQITMTNTALAAGAKVSFQVGNSTVLATDIPIVCVVSGGTANAYRADVTAVAGSVFTVTVENITAGSLSESPVIGFAVIKAVTS